MDKKDKQILLNAGYESAIPLKFENDEYVKHSDLRDFLHDTLVHYNQNLCTCYPNGKIQCFPGKGRSLGDLFRLASYYFKNVRLFQVKAELLMFKMRLAGHFCPDIQRRIYLHKDLVETYSMFDTGETDEFGETIYYLDNNGNKLATYRDICIAEAKLKDYTEESILQDILKYNPGITDLCTDIRCKFFTENTVTISALINNREVEYNANYTSIKHIDLENALLGIYNMVRNLYWQDRL